MSNRWRRRTPSPAFSSHFAMAREEHYEDWHADGCKYCWQDAARRLCARAHIICSAARVAGKKRSACIVSVLVIFLVV